MKRSVLDSSVAACFCLGLVTPLLAAQPAATGVVSDPSVSAENVSAAKPAETCLNDLRAFDRQMEKDGYWLGGAGYGLGYPVGYGGLGYPMAGVPAASADGYQDARSGYEVRTLLASARILAQHGQQQVCEDVLATTGAVYKTYSATMHSGNVPVADVPNWRLQQISIAQPVASMNTSFRSDVLLGIEVFGPKNESLGSVDDIVTSPQTGKIAYLVIGRGGFFGIDEKYVPVPWADFKAPPAVGVLVLDTTKSAMDAAPQVNEDEFFTAGHFDQESQKVNAYWKTNISN
jgi:sporulation protein YlmC with PRC-barrel domain